MEKTERDRLVVLETKVDNIDTKLDKIIADHETRIRNLECKPGKRWETVIAVLITAFITTGISLIITQLTGCN